MFHTHTLPVSGFQYAAIHSGIKKKKDDLALIVCPNGAYVAGTFTTNKTKAAPVIISEQLVAEGNPIHAVVINSGNANACTGLKGYDDACQIAQLTADLLHTAPSAILLASTGVIGVPLPMTCFTDGLPKAVSLLNPNQLDRVAEGIMTTDTLRKTCAITAQLTTGEIFTLSGIAKGSGMIHPNMATMLGFVMTDLAIPCKQLTAITQAVVNKTFNMVTVDGDTSTNDMFLVLSSGCLGNDVNALCPEDLDRFETALLEVAKSLAISIAKDGEGASKLLTVKLSGAATETDAKALAKSVVGSSLVKAAFFGKDANWGRIVCALGYANAAFDPNQVDLSLHSKYGTLDLMAGGTPLAFSETFALEVLAADEVDILICLNQGHASAEAWGCDLTYDYVKINGAYRT